MRALWVICLAFGLVSLASAQQAKDLEPIPEPPPPPAGYEPDPELEPQVTIITRGEEKVEEYRVRGRLVMIKVTPRHGRPYFLIDQRGDGTMVRQESFDSGLRVPQWLIREF